MGKIFFFILLSVVLIGCQRDSEKAITAAKGALSDVLLDGDSAKYKDVAFYPIPTKKHQSDEGYVCGEINAKNSYGAYTGFVSFYVKVKRYADGFMGQSRNIEKTGSEKWSEFKKGYSRYCHEYSIEEYRGHAELYQTDISNKDISTVITIYNNLSDIGLSMYGHSFSCDKVDECKILVNDGINKTYSIKATIDERRYNYLKLEEPNQLIASFEKSDKVIVSIPIEKFGIVDFTFNSDSYLK